MERFWNKVNKTDYCWEWQAGKLRDGYGAFWYKGKTVQAHRMSFYLKHGHWPKPQANHTCDNSSCVNPDHIYAGNQKQNCEERLSSGSCNNRAKLTEHEAREILNNKNLTYEQLAKIYNVSTSTIGMIKSNKNWTHI